MLKRFLVCHDRTGHVERPWGVWDNEQSACISTYKTRDHAFAAKCSIEVRHAHGNWIDDKSVMSGDWTLSDAGNVEGVPIGKHSMILGDG